MRGDWQHHEFTAKNVWQGNAWEGQRIVRERSGRGRVCYGKRSRRGEKRNRTAKCGALREQRAVCEVDSLECISKRSRFREGAMTELEAAVHTRADKGRGSWGR